eukprot:FR740078.1.p2 GENE.FR740078.1~~FR740078.1.p2  ORF type:complete len:162 (-),score=24.18 FR740078.1:119-604(-)
MLKDCEEADRLERQPRQNHDREIGSWSLLDRNRRAIWELRLTERVAVELGDDGTAPLREAFGTWVVMRRGVILPPFGAPGFPPPPFNRDALTTLLNPQTFGLDLRIQDLLLSEDGSEDCFEESLQNLLRSLCKAELAASALQFDSEGDFMSRLADEDEESK